METSGLTGERMITYYNAGKISSGLEPLVRERHLKIRLNGQEVGRLASSPYDERELAIGYLLSEGILDAGVSLAEIVETAPDVVEITTVAGPEGMLSGSGPDYKKQAVAPDLFSPEQILSLIAELDQQSLTFKRTGGVHSAGLGSAQGLLKRFEDIGRHNAVDKIFGYAYLNRISLADKCLVLSGRVAHEILLKAARNEIPFILSRSAPTLMSVDMAQELGITVVGFARQERFNIYSHPQRVYPG